MKIAITQPNYLPWLGYFELLNEVDLWVSLDNVQVAKRSFIVRNRIKHGDDEPKWLTVKLQKASQKTLLNEVFLDSGNWWQDHLNRIKSFYQKTSYFSTYYPEIEQIIPPKEDESTLAMYNHRVIKNLANLLGIQFDSIQASEVESKLFGTPQEKLLSICKHFNPSALLNFQKGIEAGLYDAATMEAHGMRLYKQVYKHPVYTQPSKTFTSFLSVIDLLFNEGANSKDILLSGRNWELVKPLS